MGTVSQPEGGHNPSAERKLCKVSLEEKTSIVVRSERLRGIKVISFHYNKCSSPEQVILKPREDALRTTC
jgi:hypothetical protein